jgi:metal-responsive CopG/Arc/MetJ family transcriptional regulator
MEEKLTEEIRVMVQSSLYRLFKKACKEDYKTISEVIRDYMVQYTERYNGKDKRFKKHKNK